MNYEKSNKTLTEYQAHKLREIVDSIVTCCNDKRTYTKEKFGIPYAEITCLLLFKGERYLTVKDLAVKMEVAKSRITKIIKGLMAKGLVEKIEDPKDNRVKLLSLTPNGYKKIEEIEKFRLEIHKKLINNIDPHERGKLFYYLDKLIESMQLVKEELLK